MFEGDQLTGQIRDVIEGMTGAQSLQLVTSIHYFLDLFYSFGLMYLRGTIEVIAGPVAVALSHIKILFPIATRRKNPPACVDNGAGYPDKSPGVEHLFPAIKT